MIHIGNNINISDREFLGVFDLDNASMSKITREYLKNMQKQLKVVNISNDVPKAFVVTDNKLTDSVYLTKLSSISLARRANNTYTGKKNH